VPDAPFFFYQDKKRVPSAGWWNDIWLEDLQQAIFVKGGHILPILQHENCMALLACIDNPITLEIYPDGD